MGSHKLIGRSLDTAKKKNFWKPRDIRFRREEAQKENKKEIKEKSLTRE